MSSARRAVMLVLVLVSLALAAALISPLATLSGVQAVESAYVSATPRHRLAADSVIALLPALLADSRRQQQLERTNRTHVAFDLADLHIDALLQDDTAKLPVGLWGHQRQRATALPDALHSLQGLLALPPLRLRLVETEPGGQAPATRHWTGCLDDLFENPTDEALFGTPHSASAWAQHVTPVGTGVHAYRADGAVLEAALQDLAPALGTQLARRRAGQVKPDLAELLGKLEVSEQVRRAVAERLTVRSDRFSLLVRTQLGPDVRQRYVVCDTAEPPNVLINWEVAP